MNIQPLLADINTSQGGLIHLGISFVLLAVVAVCVWYVIEWMKLPDKIALIVRIICGLCRHPCPSQAVRHLLKERRSQDFHPAYSPTGSSASGHWRIPVRQSAHQGSFPPSWKVPTGHGLVPATWGDRALKMADMTRLALATFR
jgi:hypothetical protein